jgi:uncharacterized protein
MEPQVERFSFAARLGGHVRTVLPFVLGGLRPPLAPASTPWTAMLEDPDLGPVRISGRLSEAPGSDEALVIVHGISGSAESPYCVLAARAAAAHGIASLRLGLRGSDGSGQDFYHGGQTADLAAALRSPELAAFERIYLLGFSLGGHICLRWSLRPTDRRVRSVAAVSAPLDLGAACRNIDRPACWPYRRVILAGLVQGYAAVAARRSVPTPLETVRRVRRLRDWDSLSIVPRYHFAGVEDYYDSVSVGPHVGDLRLPALFVAAEHDPMVPADTLRLYLRRASSALDVRWLRDAGHVGFPRQLSLGEACPPGLEAQLIGWLRRHASLPGAEGP